MSEDEFLIPEWEALDIPEDDDAEDDDVNPHGEEDGDEDGNS